MVIKEKSKGNGYGVASLILGILSVPLMILPYFGVVFSILAIIFSRKGNITGISLAGMILGIITVTISSIMLFILMIVLMAYW